MVFEFTQFIVFFIWLGLGLVFFNEKYVQNLGVRVRVRVGVIVRVC